MRQKLAIGLHVHVEKHLSKVSLLYNQITEDSASWAGARTIIITKSMLYSTTQRCVDKKNSYQICTADRGMFKQRRCVHVWNGYHRVGGHDLVQRSHRLVWLIMLRRGVDWLYWLSKINKKQDHCQIYTRSKQPDASRDLILALRELAVWLYQSYFIFHTFLGLEYMLNCLNIEFVSPSFCLESGMSIFQARNFTLGYVQVHPTMHHFRIPRHTQ